LLPDLGRAGADGDPDMARARLFEQLLTLLERLGEADARPVALVIEDAHWADPSSRDLISFLVRNQQTAPASLIAITYRSDELDRTHPLRHLLAELDRLPWVRRLELSRLRKREVTAQARAILGREPAAELVDEIYRRSDGNPLFAEALLAHDGQDLPESLSDLLLSRARRLPEQTQHVLRTAAAGGARVGHALLAGVAGLDDAALTQALRPAVDANLLVVDGDTYGFRHALIQEAVHGDLLPGERIALHTRYGEALEGDATALPELAHHWYAAHDGARALAAAWRAAVDAGRSLAYAEQLRMLTRVLELWDAVPDAAERIGADRATVLHGAVGAAHWAGEHERSEVLATAALRAVDQETDPARAAGLLHLRSVARWHLGREDDLTDLREAVRIAPVDDPARAPVLVALASRLMQIPRHDEARAVAEEALALARRTGDTWAEATALIDLATLSAREGDFTQLARIAEAGAIAESSGAQAILMLALHWQSHLLAAYGEGERAAEVARRGIAVATQVGLARTSGALHAVNLADALIALGRWDEALEVIERTLELAPAPDARAHLLRFRGVIGLARGDFELPEAAVGEMRDVVSARDTHDVREILPGIGLEIELRLAQGRAADVVSVAERALSDFDLQRSSRFTWPLLVSGVRAVRAAGAHTEQAAAVLAGLRTHAEKLPVATPVQHAHALTFDAESALAEGVLDRAAWDAAAAAWHDVAEPYPEASALLNAAEAAATDSDRDSAAEQLRRAAELADQLGAGPLRDRIDNLARRARIILWPNDVEPTDDPVEQARRQLGLTARELEVLRLVADGLSNRAIAEELFISPKTASVHVSNILAKLGVSARVEAAATAHRLHLFDA